MKLNRKSLLLIIMLGFLGNLEAETICTTKKHPNDTIETVSSQKKTSFSFKPKIGLTFSDSKSSGIRTSTLDYLASINSNFDYFGTKFQLNSNLFLKYGQKLEKGVDPLTIGNSFIWTVTPSFSLINIPSLRLFFENSLETQLGKGYIEGKEVSFFDPLFLYQTIFFGQRHYSFQQRKKFNWDITYGVGYSIQETINNEYNLAGSKTGFESGLSGIIEFKVVSQLTESLDFEFYSKAVALTREEITNWDNMRRTLLIKSGIFYKRIGIEYINRIVHDINFSTESFYEQSLMFTLSFYLKI